MVADDPDDERNGILDFEAARRWAIVIGIDNYRDEALNLAGAVNDAIEFHGWVTSTAGPRIPEKNVWLLLGHADEREHKDERKVEPTKDNILRAIGDLIRESGGSGQAFYFYFSGHGITSSYAGREESALATSGFDEAHGEETIAVRSIAEFFETTQLEDQFFFIDACRNKPRPHLSQIGKWSIPRRRDPGLPPVQQFLLYATSPGNVAEEIGWPGEANGAFSSVLMPALKGRGRSKAWSWQRNCYEVRWETLATYVKSKMEQRRDKLIEGERGTSAIQIPQDAGSRGALGRDRDARLAVVSGHDIDHLPLKLELHANPGEEIAIEILDAVGDTVQIVEDATESPYTFMLLPRTYAVRAKGAADRRGRLPFPVELYDDPGSDDVLAEIDWSAADVNQEGEGDGAIEIRCSDPLAVADIRDEAGHVIGVATQAKAVQTPPGFYRVRQVGPGRDDAGQEEFLVIRPGQRQVVQLTGPPPDAHVSSLAESLGGGVGPDYVVPVAGAEPAAWAEPSTVCAVAVGAALQRDDGASAALGGQMAPSALDQLDSGIAVFALAGNGDAAAHETLRVRKWCAGSPVPKETSPLQPSGAGIASVLAAADAVPHWLSFESENAKPLVLALTLLPGRLATVVAQVDAGGIRLYQFHPTLSVGEGSTPARLRRLEYLQRLLLGGRLDGAVSLAKELAARASEDPFAGCLAGYVLLRLGRREELRELASTIIAVAPQLSDGYILRGEYEAHAQNTDASNQAFAEAVAAGVPVFGEGLTRLVEGLRVSGFVHPRGWLVRYIFQQHARGVMWSAFTPRGNFDPDRLVVTGIDIGYEG